MLSCIEICRHCTHSKNILHLSNLAKVLYHAFLSGTTREREHKCNSRRADCRMNFVSPCSLRLLSESKCCWPRPSPQHRWSRSRAIHHLAQQHLTVYCHFVARRPPVRRHVDQHFSWLGQVPVCPVDVGCTGNALAKTAPRVTTRSGAS